MHPARGDKSSRGEERGDPELGLAWGPAAPFPVAWQGAGRLWSLFSLQQPLESLCCGSACLLELFHITVSTYLWGWFSAAFTHVAKLCPKSMTKPNCTILLSGSPISTSFVNQAYKTRILFFISTRTYAPAHGCGCRSPLLTAPAQVSVTAGWRAEGKFSLKLTHTFMLIFMCFGSFLCIFSHFQVPSSFSPVCLQVN